MAQAPEELSRLYRTNEARREALLALSVVFGGGVLGYQVGCALRSGDLFGTDPVTASPEAGAAALAGGLALTGAMYYEAAKEYGWGKVLAGLGGLTVLAYGLRALRS